MSNLSIISPESVPGFGVFLKYHNQKCLSSLHTYSFGKMHSDHQKCSSHWGHDGNTQGAKEKIMILKSGSCSFVLDPWLQSDEINQHGTD